MTDVLTPEQRRKNMQHIKANDTRIEVLLRKALWQKGFRYRKNYKELPGTPDIVLTQYKIAIFCDGEFFHGKDSLAERLDDTKHYIDHGLQEHNGKRELVHGKVYSDVFKQIIVLSASEFEIMSKALCHKKGVKTKKIGDISETILGTFPKIIEFEVSTPFWINTPLQDWKTKRIDGGKNIKVEGLDWWFAYNSIKHDEVGSITDATLENAIIISKLSIF